MKVLFASILVAGALVANPSIAALATGGPQHGTTVVPPGTCGFGRVLKTYCRLRYLPPHAKLQKTCKRLCVPA